MSGADEPGFLFVHKFPVMRLFVLKKSGMSLKAGAVEVSSQVNTYRGYGFPRFVAF